MRLRLSQPPGPDRFYAEIRASADRLASIVSAHDPELPVPACPDWTLRQLATHLGQVHRWAAETVRTRSADRIPFSAAPDGRYPAEPDARAHWLRTGAERVIAEIAAAGSEPVWAFGRLAPASFWARRQAHETMLHRADAELAVGAPVTLDHGLAIDGIDEFLAATASYRRRANGPEPLAAGTVLRLGADGPGPAGRGQVLAGWQVTGAAGGGLVVRRDDDGPTVAGPTVASPTVAGPTVAGPAVTVTGPADRLLLVLVRRLPPDEPAISVTGSQQVLSTWLAGTPL